MPLQPWQTAFIEALRETGNDPPWELLDRSYMDIVTPALIRRPILDCYVCPAVAVIFHKTEIKVSGSHWDMMCAYLSIKEDQLDKIVAAADNFTHNEKFDPEFRQAMLEATGLDQGAPHETRRLGTEIY